MAAKKSQDAQMPRRGRKRRVSYVYLQKLFAGVSLLAFMVVVIVGLLAQVSVVTIAFRSMIVILMVTIVSKIIVRILSTYEEINSGQT